MKTYNKKNFEYIKENDTPLKKLLLGYTSKSKSSFEISLEDILLHCGLLSANVDSTLDKSSKYFAYINCNRDNIFRQKEGITDFIKYPTTYKKAQEMLANKVISILHFTGYNKIKKRMDNY